MAEGYQNDHAMNGSDNEKTPQRAEVHTYASESMVYAMNWSVSATRMHAGALHRVEPRLACHNGWSMRAHA